MRGRKDLDRYPKQVSNGKYRDKKEIYMLGFFMLETKTDVNITQETQAKKK